MAEGKISYAEYWKEVRAMAKGVKRQAKERDEDEYDVLHEMVDGHEWIIYTWAYPWVLIQSANEDALFDEMGPTEATDYAQIMGQMAFMAFRADIAEELSG